MDYKPKNREWVKNAAIIFLAVLLVLTFFSNTWMNRSLPEVATQAVADGSITAKVRGTGTVTAIGSHQVKAKETREIRAVMIKVGQNVNTGDVLFVLGQGEASELEQAQENLRQLQVSYQRIAASASRASDYSVYEQRVESARIKLEEAEEAMRRAEELINQSADSELIEETAERLKLAIAERDRLLKELNDSEETEARIQAKQNELAEKQAQLAELEQQLSALDCSQPQDGEESGENPPDTSAERDQLQIRIASLKNESDVLAAEISAMQDDLDGKTSALDAAQAEVDKWENRYYNVINASGGGYSDNYRLARDNYYQALENYNSAVSALNDKMNSDAQSAAVTGIELMDIAQQIEKAKEKLASLSGGEDNVITANVSGVVQSLECSAGDTKLKNDILCTIEVPDMGHTLSFSVTNEQARRLRVGDTGSISNYYWGQQITATLTTIQTDPKNPQNNKLLTFDLEGEVNTGAELTISVGQKSARYDTIVPNSAIRSDSNGSFVLAVESRSSPLGNRYVARRVNVEVIAADDNNSAVTADLHNGDYVITTSSAPIKSGELVRLADA